MILNKKTGGELTIATLKDIAKIAGVSHGTVSNVLNGKGNVSVEKIKSVEDAAKKLGYSINAQAKQLRKTSGLSPIIAVIVPNIAESKYSILFSNIKKYFEEKNYIVLLFITDDMPYIEKSAVTTIATMRVSGVISVTCCPDTPEIYEPLEKAGSRILFAERRVSSSKDYIGFDFYRVGVDIASYVVQHNFKFIGLVRGLDIFSNEIDFENGLVYGLKKFNLDISSTVIETDLLTSVKAPFSFFDSSTPPDVVITTSECLTNNVELAYSVNARKNPHIISLFPNGFFSEERKLSRFYMNYDNLGFEAAKILDAHIVHKVNETCKKIIPTKGFDTPYSPRPFKKGVTINAIMVKGQANAIINMAPKFTAQTGIKINFLVIPPNEMYETITRIGSENYFDIFKINMFMMPIFSEKNLMPLEAEFFTEMTKSMIPKIVSEFSYIGDTSFSVPFDVGTQMLVYRKDLFEDTMIRRMYYEMFNENLEVPLNFDDFNKIASFFTKNFNKYSPVEYGTSSSLSTNSGICTNFEIRYRGYGGKMRCEDNGFKIDDDIILKTMKNYEDSFQYSSITYEDYWGGANINNFVNGNTAMEIVFINYASRLTDLKSSKLGGRIGYSFIPGNCPSLGGGALSVSANCREPEAAMEFIRWACGKNQAELYTLLGGLSPHAHVFENRQILNLYPWYSLLSATIDRCVGRGIFNKINIFEYEKLAGLIIRNVISKIMTYEEGLSLFKKEINKIKRNNYHC